MRKAPNVTCILAHRDNALHYFGDDDTLSVTCQHLYRDVIILNKPKKY